MNELVAPIETLVNSSMNDTDKILRTRVNNIQLQDAALIYRDVLAIQNRVMNLRRRVDGIINPLSSQSKPARMVR